MAPSTPRRPPPPPRPLLLLPLLFVLLLFCSSPATTATTIHNRVTTYPSFQHLNVKRAIKETRITTDHRHHRHRRQSESSSSSETKRAQQDADESFSLSVNHEDDTGNNNTIPHHRLQFSLKLNLIHRDNLPSPSSPATTVSNHTTRLLHRLRRDAARLAALTLRLSSNQPPLYSTSEFGSDVISGMTEGSGEYFVRVGVGSPPRPQYMVIDTGSDVVWVQCRPCSPCYRQSDPVFDPSLSASFSAVSCRSLLCSRVENTGCSSSSSSPPAAAAAQQQYCSYSVLYSDGSYTKGTLALETLTVGSTRIRNLAIGCGHRNTGMFVGAAGLMGLGGGSMSMVGQLGGQTGGAFSYCLVSRGGGGYSTSSTGTLVFGRESLPVGAAWVNLLRNPEAPSFYYVGMSGLGVGGVRVAVAESVFEMSESTGEGGVVMDTGTAVTRLPEEAYAALRDAFRTHTASLPRKGAVSIFDTCYDLAGFVAVRVPTVSFYFRDGPVLTLPARNFLIPVDEAGTFCFAFAASGSGLSVIGNIQQEGIQISIDGANGFVGFGPNVC